MMGYKGGIGNHRVPLYLSPLSSNQGEEGLLVFKARCLRMLYFIQAIHAMFGYSFEVRILSYAFCMSLGSRKAAGLVTPGHSQVICTA